jgi:hypothetical protein
MHAEIRQAGPGRCPKCGMNLVPVNEGTPGTKAVTFGTYALLAIAAFFLWTEHRAHVLGALPWLLLLACPVMHLLMHHGHRSHGRGETRGSAAAGEQHQHESHGC